MAQVCNTVRGSSDQEHPKGKNTRGQNGCLRSLTNSWEKQSPTKHRVSENTRERQESLSGDQGQELEENNSRTGKSRDLSKRTEAPRDISRQDEHGKGRSGQGPTEAEDIEKGRQECTELYKKVLITWITTMMWSLT